MLGNQFRALRLVTVGKSQEFRERNYHQEEAFLLKSQRRPVEEQYDKPAFDGHFPIFFFLDG